MQEINKANTKIQDFEGLSFVIKAIPKEKNHSSMMVVHIEKRKNGITATATDGRRLHTADLNLDITSGNYIPFVTKSSIVLQPVADINFPDWKRVVPKIGREIAILDFSGAGINKKNNQCAQMSKQLICLFEKTKQAVNVQYLDDLSKATWTVFASQGSTRAVFLKRADGDCERSAIIMPMEIAA